MYDSLKTQLRFVLKLADQRITVASFAVHVPDVTSGIEQSKIEWKPLIAVLLRYKLLTTGSTARGVVTLDDDSLGSTDQSVFHQAWALIKNHLNRGTTGADEKGRYHQYIKGIVQRGEMPRRIEIDSEVLPGGNIEVSVRVNDHPSKELTQPMEWQCALDALMGRGFSGLFAVLEHEELAVTPAQPFRFGSKLTRTFVAHQFPDGVPPELIECREVADTFNMPDELMPLVHEACRIVASAQPSGRATADAPVYYPVRVDSVWAYDEDRVKVVVQLGTSHYQFYTAAAYAEALARKDRKFEPLWRFVGQVTDPRINSPASCSMGTRIMLETSDARFIVCYRSDLVKMNPNMWSSSANEGLRPSAREAGSPFGELLQQGAWRALLNELRVAKHDLNSLLLVSIHQNAYGQWGASFYARTVLSSQQVIERQRSAGHRYEHRELAALPLELPACGKAMAKLGSRWYGGALETICSALSVRAAADRKIVTPESIGDVLDNTSGRVIVPCDEVNLALLRMAG